MKKIIQIVAVMLAALFLLTACNSTPAGPNDDTTVDTTLNDDTTTGGEGDTEEPKEERKGLALNVDPDAIYYMLNKPKFKVDGKWNVDNLEAKAIEHFNDCYTDCGISDLFYNIASAAPYASDDPDLYDKIDKYYTTEENGIEVDYTMEEDLIASWMVYENTYVDPYQVWFEQCRLNGINPWLSFRMNDAHYTTAPTGHSPFAYKARENGWLIGNLRTPYWYSNKCTSSSYRNYEYCLDYSVPQVREYFLKEIEDRLSTYDCYGIELD